MSPDADFVAAQRRRLAFDNGGNDLDQSIKVHWKNPVFYTWDEAVEQMAQGLTVTARCNGNTLRGGWSRHKIRFNADGSIDLLNHPDVVIDRDAELMLAALGATTCTCVAVAMYLPDRQLAPRSISTHNMINVRLRTLHAAIAWAQHPDTPWSREFGDTYLRYGITPAVIAEWTADGWEADKALRFQQTFTPLPLANEWRSHGNVTLRAAKLAGRGEYPNAESRWAAAGFTASQSAKWRVTNLLPAEAYEWEQANVAPSLVSKFKRAATQGGIPVEVVQQWCTAGVPSADFDRFYNLAQGDLDEALEWASRKISANTYYGVAAWNRDNPQHRLSAEQVASFRAARAFPSSSPHLMSEAIRYGITAAEFQSAVESLRTPQGRDLRRALVAAAPQDSSRAPMWKFTRGEVLEDALRALEGGWSGEVSGFILRYLHTNRLCSV